MLEAPVDTLYVWVGLALVGTAVAGTATEFPTSPPPDAQAAAASIDRVAAADHTATSQHPVAAEAVKIERMHISIRDDGRTSRARFAHQVTPVRRGSPLWRVLLGGPPGVVFDDSTAFREAVDDARAGSAHWRRTDRLVARTITWGGIHVTLVGV